MSGPFVVLALVAVLFAGACLCRFIALIREDAEQRAAIDRWWAERRQRDTSSLMDDSPGALPEEWPSRSDRTDRGPRAA